MTIGSSPAFTPSTRPSIMASEFTQAIMLLIAFAVLPAPTGPTLKMFGPIERSPGPGGPRVWGGPPAPARRRGRLRPAPPAAHRRLQEVHAARLGPRLDLAGCRGQHAAQIDQDGVGSRGVQQTPPRQIERPDVG